VIKEKHLSLFDV